VIHLDIKPLSVNQAWQGRRFKTPAYKQYARSLGLILPKNLLIPEGDLSIRLRFGFSNKQSDWDNPIKAFQDVVCTYYGINDNRIYMALVEKVLTKKGREFVQFEFYKYQGENNV